MAKGGKAEKAAKTEKQSADPQYAAYVDKEPTELQVRFGQWIQEKTGYEPDMDTLKLAVFLRIPFQASPENQAVLEEKRKKNEAKAAKRAARAAEAEAAAAAEEAKPAKKTGKAAKATATADKAAPTNEATAEDPGPTPAKATGRRRPPAKAAKATASTAAEEAF